MRNELTWTKIRFEELLLEAFVGLQAKHQRLGDGRHGLERRRLLGHRLEGEGGSRFGHGPTLVTH